MVPQAEPSLPQDTAALLYVGFSGEAGVRAGDPERQGPGEYHGPQGQCHSPP